MHICNKANFGVMNKLFLLHFILIYSSTVASTINRVLEIVRQNSFEVDSSMWVTVTHVNNPHSFYVRIRVLEELMNAVQQPGTYIQSKDLYPQILVLYESRISGIYVRGKIICINNLEQEVTCNIFAIDNGYYEQNIPVHKIRNSFDNSLLNEIPPLANQCALTHCFPKQGKEWSDDATSSLIFFLGEERTWLTVTGKRLGAFVVELVGSCSVKMSMLMAYAECSILGNFCNANSHSVSVLGLPEPEKRYFTFKDVKQGDTIQVRVQSGKDLNGFYVAEKNDHEFYLNQRSNITSFSSRSDRLTIDDIHVNDAVAVMLPTNYYERAIIREVLETEKVRVQLVDWGSTEVVHLNRLTSLRECFLIHPVTAMYCTMVNKVVPATISRLLLGYEFLITIVEVGDKFDVPHKVLASVIN